MERELGVMRVKLASFFQRPAMTRAGWRLIDRPVGRGSISVSDCTPPPRALRQLPAVHLSSPGYRSEDVLTAVQCEIHGQVSSLSSNVARAAQRAWQRAGRRDQLRTADPRTFVTRIRSRDSYARSGTHEERCAGGKPLLQLKGTLLSQAGSQADIAHFRAARGRRHVPPARAQDSSRLRLPRFHPLCTRYLRLSTVASSEEAKLMI